MRLCWAGFESLNSVFDDVGRLVVAFFARYTLIAMFTVFELSIFI